MKFKYPVELTEEELDTICSALAVYLITHRTDMEDSRFQQQSSTPDESGSRRPCCGIN